MNDSEFMLALRAQFPDFAEALDDQPELLHLEVGAFARYTQAAIDRHDDGELRACVTFAHRAWSEGDDPVQNAIGVSFLEHLNFEDGKVPRSWAFTRLTPALREAAHSLGVGPGYRRP